MSGAMEYHERREMIEIMSEVLGEDVDRPVEALRKIVEQARRAERSLQVAASCESPQAIYASVYIKAFVPGGSVHERRAREQVAREAAKRAVVFMAEDVDAASMPIVDNDAPLADGIDVLTRDAVDAMTAIYNREQMDAARAVISSVIDGRLADAHSALLALARRVKR